MEVQRTSQGLDIYTLKELRASVKLYSDESCRSMLYMLICREIDEHEQIASGTIAIIHEFILAVKEKYSTSC